MKIAIDLRSAEGEKAGKGWFTFNIVRELLKSDKHNEYILYAKSGIAGFEEFKNLTFKVISTRGPLWHFYVMRDLKKENVDLFIAPSSFIIPALINTKRTKTIVVVHDLVAFLFPETHESKAVFVEKLFMKKAIKKAKDIVAVSENTKKDIIEKFKTDPEKMKVIPCAASEDFTPATTPISEDMIEFRKKTELPEKFFLAVGTIEPRKNYESLIQAFSMFHEKNKDHHLIIVGKRGWGLDGMILEDMIRQNYLQKFVHFIGYITTRNLVRLYNLAEALVFPSYYEGFGMPPLEAMKSGCPVISSYTSSMPEVLGEAAIFCNPESPVEFAKAMEDIAVNDQKRTDLINKGRIQSKKFSWKDSAEKLVSIY